LFWVYIVLLINPNVGGDTLYIWSFLELVDSKLEFVEVMRTYQFTFKTIKEELKPKP